jgi:tetratricopeptide (TPR) repeat protein/transglutaminase-like putative cysteine protease
MFLRSALCAFCMLELMSVPLPAAPRQVRPGGSSQTGQKSEASGASEKNTEPGNYSREPYVIEHYDTTARFENDGTGERDLSVRVRVQSEEGAQQFREIVFGYNSANEKAEVRSLTVRKHGASTANVRTAEAVKEMPSAAVRDAPAYSEYKDVHVSVPSLQAGDVLEYQIATQVVTPFAPGEFWFQYSFLRDAIVLDERLELSLPQNRPFSIKSPGFYQIAGKESRPARSGSLDSRDFVFTRSAENGRTLFGWKRANLTHPSQEEQQAAKDQRATPPDLQPTSFQNWNAVARWYTHLQEKNSGPSSEITAKTRELIKGATTDLEKMRALYAYMSKNIRSVNLSLDLGGLQPLPPQSVLANGYGDALDKQALLLAMLRAAGIPADAVLISAGRRLDADLPSPAQFDRDLTIVPQNGKIIWMDSTAEVAPFRFLPASLRSKPALLVSADGAGKLVETPADPPFPSTQQVELECKLSELGKLSGTIHYSLRGDTEFLLRTAFRRAPGAEWNQLAQTILTLDGLRGEVARVTTSDPLDTEKPFELSIQFSQPNVLDWPNKKTRIALPLLTIATPDPPTKSTQPVKLGSPLAVTTRLRLTFPLDFTVQTPVGVAVSRDYAEFKSSYRFENSTLIAERSLNFKMRELPASRTSDYLAFTHAVEADEGQALLVENPSASATAIPPNATAEDVFEAGAAALQSGNVKAAIPLLQRATELEPGHKQAWGDIGLAYLRVGKFDDAIAALRRQLEVNPTDEHANDYLGLALEQQQRSEEAAAAFRAQIELNPLDTVAHAALGSILLSQRNYSDAVPELEKAVILSPDDAALDVRLGRAYLNVGDKAKALDSFQKGINLSATPAVWNDVAFSLAEQGIELDRAQRYAESAIAAIAADLQKTTLAHATARDFARVDDIGDYWDTLGWVYFQKGDLSKARRYVGAAWLLNQRGEIGDHLARVYEKAGQKDRAIHTYALALAAANPVPETRARLTLLLGGNAQIDDLVSKAQPELENMRTFRVKQTSKEASSADFFVLMSPDGKEGALTTIAEVRFLSGSEALRSFGDSLKALDYGTIFPDASPVKLLRRGTLICSAASGDCRFTLILPENVHGLN